MPVRSSSPEETTTRAPSRARRSAGAAVGLCTAAALMPLNSTMIAVALLDIEGDLDVSVSAVTWLVSGDLVVVAAARPLGGRIGDALGHRRAFLAGLAGFPVASALAPFAPWFAGLVVLVALLEEGAGPEIVTWPLLLAGSGLGAMASQLGSVTVSSVPDEMSGQVGGLQNTGTQLGASIGTALAGAILVSALTASFFAGIQGNPDVPASVAAKAETELAGGIPFLSNADLEDALAEADFERYFRARRDAVRNPVYDRYLSINRHQPTPDGWVHWQDNTKMGIKDGKLVPIVQEYVLNTYIKYDQYDVKAADDYWAATKEYWAAVRAEWDRVAATKGGIAIAEEAETGTVISGRLLSMADEVREKKLSIDKAIAEAKRLIEANTRKL